MSEVGARSSRLSSNLPWLMVEDKMKIMSWICEEGMGIGNDPDNLGRVGLIASMSSMAWIQ